MEISQIALLWVVCGLLNYWIKYDRFKDDWKSEGQQVFFVAVLVACLFFGPVGLIISLIRDKGIVFRKRH